MKILHVFTSLQGALIFLAGDAISAQYSACFHDSVIRYFFE